jgi:hypothetical protein
VSKPSYRKTVPIALLCSPLIGALCASLSLHPFRPSSGFPPLAELGVERGRELSIGVLVVLSDLLNAKPAEVCSFLRGKLPPSQTKEFQSEIRAAGIPF